MISGGKENNYTYLSATLQQGSDDVVLKHTEIIKFDLNMNYIDRYINN